MPNSPSRICSSPGCFVIVRDGGNRCVKHAEEYRTRRRGIPENRGSRPTDPFLGSTAWQKLRKAKLASNPVCERCERDGRTTPATQVHHVKARQDAPDEALAWENLESICTRCHRAATVQATRERKQM